MSTRTLEQRRAQTANSRQALAARRELGRQRREQAAAAAAVAQENTLNGYEERRLVAHWSAWAGNAWVEQREQVRPVRAADSRGELLELVCVECSEFIGAELYANCNRCGLPVRAPCGYRGYRGGIPAPFWHGLPRPTGGSAYLGDREVEAAAARGREARWQVFRAGDAAPLERPPRAGDPCKGRLEAMGGARRVIPMIGEHRAALAELDSQTL
ncbi:unnamed protein product, partial [Prorocentrum cordatum]